jgi:hypothetical protein
MEKRSYYPAIENWGCKLSVLKRQGGDTRTMLIYLGENRQWDGS